MMKIIPRRQFLKAASLGVASVPLIPYSTCLNIPLGKYFFPGCAYAESSSNSLTYTGASHFKKLGEDKVECELCPKKCVVADMERGYCGVRENRKGHYYTLVYSRPCTVHNDPIEKKPLFHYLPGTTALSLATAGCNMECKFCQNWRISQFRPEQVESMEVSPGQMVNMALKYKSPTIAYTYSEPVIFYEYMYDIAKEAKKSGIGSVMISNGYIERKPMTDLLEHLTAVKVDLKAFTEKFYRDSCSGKLRPVLETLELIRKMGKWLEIVVLIIPTLNDSEKEIREMCAWVNKSLGPDVPVHFSRYHPMYKIKNIPPTPVRTLDQCHKIGISEGLNFVYVGNVRGHKGENTYCPKCKKILIRRVGYYIESNSIVAGKCKFCGEPIPGVWGHKR